jgi:hypothetical protein
MFARFPLWPSGLEDPSVQYAFNNLRDIVSRSLFFVWCRPRVRSP